MTTPWSEVSASPEFNALPPEAKEAARQQYFKEVVAPQVPADKLSEVKTQFDADTGFKSTVGGAALGNPSIEKQGRAALRTGPFDSTGVTAIGMAGGLGGAIGGVWLALVKLIPVRSPRYVPLLFVSGTK